MEIIDLHAHIYPDRIAEKATLAIGDFYNFKMKNKAGTAGNLIENGKSAGVSRFVVHSCATKPNQVRSINEFIKEETDENEEFIGFMTLHQDLTEEEMFSEVEWGVKNGFKGVKLHPDFQKFDIDDERFFKIYRAVEGRLPVLFHTGDNRYDYSKPHRLYKVAKLFPNVNFIGAHFGAYRCWEEVGDYKNGLDNLFFDTSSSLLYIGYDRAKALIDKFGSEKFFFGTDFPMHDLKEEIERFMRIPITDKQREEIFAKNIKNFLQIE